MTVSDGYQLPRNSSETNRLTLQHWTMIKRQGYILHPDIQSAISHIESPRIVDVGTGTGIWATELAEALPQAQVVGLDISDAQYPPRWAWPENATLGVMDLTAEIPKQYQEAFDIVHLRLMVGMGPRIEKGFFLSQLTKMLKPGGWLQLDEVAWPVMFYVTPEQSQCDVIHQDDLKGIPEGEVFASYNDWVERLDLIANFEDIVGKSDNLKAAKKYIVPFKKSLMPMEYELSLAVWTGWATMFMQSQTEENAKLRKEIDECLKSFSGYKDKGILTPYNWNICIAQKRNNP